MYTTLAKVFSMNDVQYSFGYDKAMIFRSRKRSMNILEVNQDTDYIIWNQTKLECVKKLTPLPKRSAFSTSESTSIAFVFKLWW